MNKIMGILIDVNKNHMVKINIEDKLEEFYRILKCDAIDCVSRVINGVHVVIVCDDNGFYVEDAIPSMVGISSDNEVEEIIVGNVFICKSDDEGNFESLSYEDILKILLSKDFIREPNLNQQILVYRFE